MINIGHYVAKLNDLDSFHQLKMSRWGKTTTEVFAMLIILSIYSSILALAVWQQEQNDTSTSLDDRQGKTKDERVCVN